MTTGACRLVGLLFSKSIPGTEEEISFFLTETLQDGSGDAGEDHGPAGGGGKRRRDCGANSSE